MYYTGLNSVNKSYPFDSLPVIHLFHTIKDVSEVRLVITDYVGHPTIRVTTKYPIYLYDNSFLVKYREMKTIHLDKEHTKLPDMLDSLKSNELINDQIITEKKLKTDPNNENSIYQSNNLLLNTLTKKHNYYTRAVDYILYKKMDRYYAIRYLEYYLTMKRLLHVKHPFSRCQMIEVCQLEKKYQD